MSITGHLVPFLDPGAADLMSNHLDQEVHIDGPGKILLRVALPRTVPLKPGTPSSSGDCFARKSLEVFKKDGENWLLLWSATSDSDHATEEVSLDVASAGILKCRLTNMSGMEGQFSLDCAFTPREDL